jgi:hypothetical protein
MARTTVPATCLAMLLSLAVRAGSLAPNPSVPAPPGILVDVGGYRVHLYCAGQGNQAKLLSLSQKSKHIIAWNSTHMVPIDEPAVIVDTIHEVVERVRKAENASPLR